MSTNSANPGPPDELVDHIVLDEATIQQRVEELGKQLTKDYEGKSLLAIGILRGAFIFMADLIREMDLSLTVDFMLVSSYEDLKSSSGAVRIVMGAKKNIQDRHVLIVEDIIDTGQTYNSLKNTLETRSPASLKICALLNKPENRKVEVPVDYHGFEVPNKFLVGYGLDYREFHRECPYIFVPTQDALDQLEG